MAGTMIVLDLVDELGPSRFKRRWRRAFSNERWVRDFIGKMNEGMLSRTQQPREIKENDGKNETVSTF